MKPYFAFQWHITDVCDQRCKHCYIFAEDSCKALNEMSFDKMEQVIESCVRMCESLGRTPYFYITGGGQRSVMVGVRNKELTTRIGIMNLVKFDRSKLAGSYVSKEQPSTIDDPTIKNGFYGAPCVVAIFGQNNFMFRTADAFCCAENMVLQAAELGISSCIISRGEETFASAEGQALLREWGVPENYSAICFVILGYIDGEQPSFKPRKENRVKIVE